MKASTTETPIKDEPAPNTRKVLGVPVLSQFYGLPEPPLIIKSALKLALRCICS